MWPLPYRGSLKESDISMSMAVNLGWRGTGNCAGIAPVVALFAGDRKSQDCQCRPLPPGKSALRSRRADRKSGTEHPGKVKPRKAFEALRGFVRWKIGGRASTKIMYFSVYIQYINFPSRIRYQQKYQQFLSVPTVRGHSLLILLKLTSWTWSGYAKRKSLRDESSRRIRESGVTEGKRKGILSNIFKHQKPPPRGQGPCGADGGLFLAG